MTANPQTGEGVSIIVACRNEQDMIGRCLAEVCAVLPRAEILVVDGGSDATFDIAAGMSREHPLIVPIRNVGDRGKGHAIKTGIARATQPVLAQFDADLQFAAADLPRLIEPVLSGACDLCLGSRFLPGSDWGSYQRIPTRDFGNRVVSLLVSVLTGRRVTDVTAGVKAWTRAAIARIDFRDDAYSYEAELIVRASVLGLRIREVPVTYASRTAGQSMHRNTFALAKAGLVIMGKSIAARWRTG